jgi:hypothetical protein
MRHNPDRGIMSQFMQFNRRVVFGVAEQVDARHVDRVGMRDIASPAAAMDDRGAGRGDERLRALDGRDRVRRRIG